MNVNGYEIKPGANLYGANFKYADLVDANLEGANLYGANLMGANVKGTILEKKEEPQDNKDLKIKELEEENRKLKEAIKVLMDTLRTGTGTLQVPL